jgi:hypothetical protein
MFANTTAATRARKQAFIAKVAARKQAKTANRHTTRTASRKAQPATAAPAVNPQAAFIQALAAALGQTPMAAALLKANGGTNVGTVGNPTPQLNTAPITLNLGDLGTHTLTFARESKGHKAVHELVLEDENSKFFISRYSK